MNPKPLILMVLALLVSPHAVFGQQRTATEELAVTLAAAPTAAERSALLEREKKLASPELVKALLAEGDKLRDKSVYKQALEIYRLTLAIAESTGDGVGIANSLARVGMVYRSQGDYAEALDYFGQSLTLAEKIGDKSVMARTLNAIGNVYVFQGEHETALRYYERSLALLEELKNNQDISRSLNNIGNIRIMQGDLRQALEVFQKSLALKEVLGDRVGIAWTLNNTGLVHTRQGNHELALEYFRRSLALMEQLENRGGMTEALNNIGNAHWQQGDFTRSLESHRRSLAISEAVGNKDGVAEALNNTGNVFRSQGDYEQALEFYRRSMQMRESLGHRAGVAILLNDLALVYQAQGEHAQSLEASERAADIARQVNRRDVLWQSRTASGNAHLALGQLDDARTAFTEAIADIEVLRDQVAGGELERQRFFESRITPYLSMVELLIAQNRNADALAYAERAKARVLLDVLRSGRVNVTKAMTTAEKERERELHRELTSLNTQLTTENMRPTADAPRLAQLNARLEKARLDYTAFQTNLYATHSELKVRRGEAPALSISDAAELLPDSKTALLEYVVTERKTYLFILTRSSTDAFKLGRNEKLTPASNEKRRDARNDNGSDARDNPPTSSSAPLPLSTTSVAAPALQLRVYTINVERKELARRAKNFREQLATRGLGFRSAARDLYDLLLKPAHKELHDKTRLVVVPDGELWDLPFQALQPDASKYLIENSEISYAQSLTVLREMMKLRARYSSARHSRSAVLLAFGNPFLGEAAASRNDNTETLKSLTKLAPLPEAERQVKALGEVYGQARSKIYVGTTASERRLKAEAPSARILHLATHGILNDASPIYSHVLLSLDEGKDGEDGLLEAWEIMNLDLQTDLVVLSACETARGKVGAGEGVIGMTWALFVAGSPTTVVSQWKVEESSTTELMLEFHRNFHQTTARPRTAPSTAGALREAALKSLRSGKRAHPFYWAGFVVVGDGR